jgi:hypothetical protein
MQTAALPDASRREEELHYITEHFRALQGLRLAPLWAALLLVAVVTPLFQLSRWHAAEISIIAVIAFAAIWLPWSHAWYRRNYGIIAAHSIFGSPSSSHFGPASRSDRLACSSACVARSTPRAALPFSSSPVASRSCIRPNGS